MFQVENQINQMLAGQLSLIDDADLEKELAELMGTNIEEPSVQLPEVPRQPVMPAVPTTPVVVNSVEEAQPEMKRNPIAA